MDKSSLKTSVYVDGFNLFYGSLKHSKYKWLDLNHLSKLYFPNNNITAIKYFSAITKSRYYDLNKPQRQQMYFRALRTLENIQIILGSFLENEVKVYVPDKDKISNPQIAGVCLGLTHTKLPLDGGNHFKILKTEEKGSDVNIGTHLIMDAYENNFDIAIVISNDSDLAEPMRIVNQMPNKQVRLLNPYPKTNLKLQNAVNGDIKTIRQGPLKDSQFSKNLTDTNGNFHIPKEWQ